MMDIRILTMLGMLAAVYRSEVQGTLSEMEEFSDDQLRDGGLENGMATLQEGVAIMNAGIEALKEAEQALNAAETMSAGMLPTTDKRGGGS